jgi:hypothetical protein
MNQIEIQEEKRFAKAKHIADLGHIHRFKGKSNRWLVKSESDKHRYYMVTVNTTAEGDFEYCSCPDSEYRGNVCKHILSICIRYTRVIA